MKRKVLLPFLQGLSLLFIFGVFSCIKPVEIDVPVLDEGIAVSAYLSTQKGGQEVRLQRLASFTTQALNYPILKAEVWMMDNLGQRQNFKEDPTRIGFYIPSNSDYVGEPGKTYVLHILTPDQQKIESRPQSLRKAPPIKKVYTEEIIVDHPRLSTVVSGFKILLDTDDPVQQGDYYRWSWVNYEQVVFCGFSAAGGLSCCEPCWDIVRCYINCTDVFSDVLVNGKTITRHPITRIPYCARDYYIEIQQRSISKEAYNYWRTVDQLSSNNGSLFDTAPAIVRGNLKCVSDSIQAVYGLFEVSDIAEGGYYISRSNTSRPGLFTCVTLPIPAPSINCATCRESPYRTRVKPKFWDR